MQTIKKIWRREPLAIVGVIGAALTFLFQNWDVIQQLLARLGVGNDWLTLIGMALTILVGRMFVTPAK